MKIAILGTRGIPNNYGGFEQFAQYISEGLVRRGHEVAVYAPDSHPYSEEYFMGVRIIKKPSPENTVGSMANFYYDHICLKDALEQGFDIIYEAGYATVALSFVILGVKKSKSIIVTNMDGIEWRRSKWNFFTKKLIHFLEKVSVRYSDFLISDNLEIKQFYLDYYKKETKFIAYGAEVVTSFLESTLIDFGVEPDFYFILVARLEPENNIELILDGYLSSHSARPFIVVGNRETSYGRELQQKYLNTSVNFVGGIYNKSVLDDLRHYSSIYFHGHSVGGTNPSLLEAMASGSLVFAHDNGFNKTVLKSSGIYFSQVSELALKIADFELSGPEKYRQFRQSSMSIIDLDYNWQLITDQYEQYFIYLLTQKKV